MSEREGTGRYRIVRHKQTEDATYGRLFDLGGQEIAVTLERPWVDADHNGKRDPDVSRFVPRTFRCVLRRSHLNGGDGHRDYDVWEFVNVPDIKNGQIHRAAWVLDLKGCVGVGSAFGTVHYTDEKDYPGITGSKIAFEKWMKETAGYAELEIEVVDAFDQVVA
jgi:hypothetical protein